MGAVTFSIDPQLVAAIKRALPLSLFVETGTFHGDSLAIVATQFDECISIEASEALWRESSARFASTPSVRVLHSDSSLALAELRARLSKAPTLFWLDAHWCVAANTAGETSQCPLLAEIDAIGQLHEQSVVLIDDARLFLAPPPEPHDVSQWPIFADVMNGLLKLSAVHELMVINDVIAFYPKAARASMEVYARTHGVDWLHARQAMTENTTIRAAMEEKEELIHRLDKALKQKDSTIAEPQKNHKDIRAERSAREAGATTQSENAENKDAVIRELSRARDLAKAGLELMQRSAAEKDRHMEAMERALETVQSQQRHIEQMLLEKERARLDTLEEMQRMRLAHQEELLLKQESVKQWQAALAALDIAQLNDSARMQRSLMSELEKKESVIQELSIALTAYRATYSKHGAIWYVQNALRSLRGAMAKIKQAARPKLGNLCQHPPIDVLVPASYSKEAPPVHPPRISIVTPSYKQAAFIERTICSVLDQGYPNLEYFVQDGGSEDGTEDILKRYGDQLSGWESKQDGGQSHAINLGLSRTSGEIMAWLNSDDILLPGALAYVANYFERNPGVDVVYGHRLLIDENDKQIGRWIMPAHSNGVLSWADFVPQETLFWRRRIWDKVGGQIDETFRFAMDWDMLVRFRDAGARFARLPRALGAFRIHTQQKTSAAISSIGFKEMDRIRERALGKIPTATQINAAIAPYLARHVLADQAWRLSNTFRRLGTWLWHARLR